MSFAIAAVLVCCGASTPQEFEQRVLVVGAADSRRAGEYVDVLDDHFAAVERIDAAVFTATSADAFDVVVVEGGGPLALPRDWNRACVAIGASGIAALEPLRSKFAATLVSPEPWFDIEGEEIAESFAARLALELGVERTETWTLLGPHLAAIGMQLALTPLAGLCDSPDVEVVATQRASDGRRGAVVVRQGHLVFWGVDQEVRLQSLAARRAFVHAIRWAADHDRAPRLVQRVSESRDAFEEWLELAFAGDGQRAARERVGAQLVAECGGDVAACRAWIEAHRPHVLWSAERGFEIDQDARALEIDNRSVDALFTCADELEGDDRERAAHALAFLRRATGQDFATSAEWLAWLEPREERLFHSDVGGYRFFEVPHPPGPIDPPEPGAAKVAFTANLVEDEHGLAIVVCARVAEGWHLYGRVAPGSAFRAATLDARLPAALIGAAEWQRPPAKPYAKERGTTLIEGRVRFRLPVTASGAIDPADLGSVTVAYQVCDALRCLSPTEVELAVVDRR
jgi:hypothetical protein